MHVGCRNTGLFRIRESGTLAMYVRIIHVPSKPERASSIYCQGNGCEHSLHKTIEIMDSIKLGARALGWGEFVYPLARRFCFQRRKINAELPVGSV